MDDLSRGAFELYKETLGLVKVTATSVYLGDGEREYVLARNEANRGEEQPIETRMLTSINDACTKAGLKIEDLHRRHVEWAGNARTRLKELGREDGYAGLMRVPSHAIHGTWMDLYKSHLREKGGKFAPDFDWSPIDARLLSPVAIWVLDAIGLYVGDWKDKEPALQIILTRCANLYDRLRTVDKWHEAAMNMNNRP